MEEMEKIEKGECYIMGDSYQQDVFLDTSTFTTKCFRHHHKQCKGNYGRCGCKCHDKV